jgi:hypothetical protein
MIATAKENEEDQKNATQSWPHVEEGGGNNDAYTLQHVQKSALDPS